MLRGVMIGDFQPIDFVCLANSDRQARRFLFSPINLLKTTSDPKT
jgi:hypothetical protein